MTDEKTVSGITYATKPNFDQEIFEPADRVILAAGTIETPKILLASSNSRWSRNGLANKTGHVGRHLVTHPLLRAIKRMPSNPSRLEQEIDFPTMISRQFDTEAYQAEGKMLFVRDGKYINTAIDEQIRMSKSASDIDHQINTGTRIELRALIEALPAEGNKVTIAPNRKTSVRLTQSKIVYKEAPDTARARVSNMKRLNHILTTAGLEESPDKNYPGARGDHATGTCRMSENANGGVVDRNLKAHDIDNLYVCSNAVFPNSGAANPTVTLVALGIRLGKHLAQPASA